MTASNNRGADNCPLPMTHDRLSEVHFFLDQMLVHYHFPDRFRYSTNAFLGATKSVVHMLTMELERAQQTEWSKQRRAEMRSDTILSAFSTGRDIALHQRQIVSGSQIEMGIFRYGRLKLAFNVAVAHDRSTYEMLEFAKQQLIGFLMDEEHTAIGEQIGVRRIYKVPELSDSEDVVTASRRAWSRLSHVVADAHALLGSQSEPIPEDGDDHHDVDSVALLQETDVDPDAVKRWDW